MGLKACATTGYHRLFFFFFSNWNDTDSSLFLILLVKGGVKFWGRTFGNKIIGEWPQTIQHTDQWMALRPSIGKKKSLGEIVCLLCIFMIQLQPHDIECHCLSSIPEDTVHSPNYSTLVEFKSEKPRLSSQILSSFLVTIPCSWMEIQGRWVIISSYKNSKCSMKSVYLPCNNGRVWDHNWWINMATTMIKNRIKVIRGNISWGTKSRPKIE